MLYIQTIREIQMKYKELDESQDKSEIHKRLQNMINYHQFELYQMENVLKNVKE